MLLHYSKVRRVHNNRGAAPTGPSRGIIDLFVDNKRSSAPTPCLSRCVTLLAGCRIGFTALFAPLHHDLPIEAPKILGVGMMGTPWVAF
jgi:hypothetical protein